jgi:hypothetical protein
MNDQLQLHRAQHSTVLAETSQLVKKFLAFCGIQLFITTLTNAQHLFLTGVRPLQSTPSRLLSLRFILILFSYLCQGLPSGLLPYVSLQKLSSPSSVPHAPINLFFICSPQYLVCAVKILKRPFTLFMPAFCYCSVDPNISLSTLLSNPLALVFPQCKKHTHPNKRQDFESVYFNILK